MALVVCPSLRIGPGDMAMAAAQRCTANDGMECAFFRVFFVSDSAASSYGVRKSQLQRRSMACQPLW